MGVDFCREREFNRNMPEGKVEGGELTMKTIPLNAAFDAGRDLVLIIHRPKVDKAGSDRVYKAGGRRVMLEGGDWTRMLLKGYEEGWREGKWDRHREFRGAPDFSFILEEDRKKDLEGKVVVSALMLERMGEVLGAQMRSSKESPYILEKIEASDKTVFLGEAIRRSHEDFPLLLENKVGGVSEFRAELARQEQVNELKLFDTILSGFVHGARVPVTKKFLGMSFSVD